MIPLVACVFVVCEVLVVRVVRMIPLGAWVFVVCEVLVVRVVWVVLVLNIYVDGKYVQELSHL